MARNQNGYLDYNQRKRFQALYRENACVSYLAGYFDISPATVYREIRRGTDGSMDKNGRLSYSARKAQETFMKNLHKRGEQKNDF